MRSSFNKSTLKPMQKIVFSFSQDVTGIGGIDPIDMLKLTPGEEVQLKLFFDRDSRQVVETLDAVKALSLALREPHFDRWVDLSELEEALEFLLKDIKNEKNI